MTRPLPVPGSLTGANRHHTVRTDEHRAWRQQLLQVNRGNVFFPFFPSPSSFAFNSSSVQTVTDCNYIPVVGETSSHVE